MKSLQLLSIGLLTIQAIMAEVAEKRPKVLITNPEIPQIGFDTLSLYCDLIVTNGTSRGSILDKVAGVDGIFWATHERLDKEILDKAGDQMKAVATMSVGYDHIDVDELTKRGIKLGNTPIVLNDAVADVGILLLLAASRRLHEARLKIETNEWNSSSLQWMLGRDITGSTVGIVGLGRVGQTVVKRLKAFNVGKFLYSGHGEKVEGKELGAEFVTFDHLLKNSDFIIVTCPLTSETRHMFNDMAFDKMKKTAVFVNISRGLVVDQDALIRALKQKKIFAAGLDVMTPEPINPDNELLKLPNCVLSPHLGSATVDTRTEMAKLTAQNLLRGIGGAPMFTPVN